jgi:4-alpha-glucanotransferase
LDPDAAFDARTRDALLRALFGAGSDIVIVPFQDLFGWRDRVNVPAVVNDENWTWRLPWAIDDLTTLPEARERAGFLSALAQECGR